MIAGPVMLHLPAALQGKVRPTANSLTIEPGLSFDEWWELGRQLRDLQRAVNWWIADWLAYGEWNFKDAAYAKRMPKGVYEFAEQLFGRRAKTLKNYKWVATSIPQGDREKLLNEDSGKDFTIQHGLELLSAKVPTKQLGMWVSNVRTSGTSTRNLRRQLRETFSDHAPEPSDAGENDFLSRTNQWAIDFLHESTTWSASQWAAYEDLLSPVLERFEDRRAA